MENKEDIEARRAVAGIGKNLAKKSWECIVAGCDQKAINSHLLQRHGVLNHIVENGHCYELRETDVFSWTKDDPPVSFKKCGLQNAISLPIFCNHHDTELFKPIESDIVDYSDYRNQLLLSYRALCAEIRRKEVVIERYKRYLGSNILNAYRKEYLYELPGAISGNELGIKDMLFYKDILEKELDNPVGCFVFNHHKYPIKGLYASSSFTIASEEETANQAEVLNDCFGHVIPNGEETEFIFGYHKDHVSEAVIDFMNGWDNLDKEQLGERLTGWFTLIESWGVSPSLYEKIKPEDKKRYFELLENSFLWVAQNPNVHFNMFKGLL